MVIKEEYICPKCKTKNRIKIHKVIEQKDIDRILNKEIFKNTCNKCSETVYVEYPLKVIGDDYLIHYTPTKNDPVNESGFLYLRVCDTFPDLKEKILIFENHLNDITIEFIKNYIINIIDSSIKEQIEGIRFNSYENDNLVFKLIGTDQQAICSIEKYHILLKQMKIKKIDKCVLIDEYTFRNYYRMRLL